MDNESIRECLQASLDKVMVQDSSLFVRDVHEGAITHRIAMYLEEEILARSPELQLVVDVEFNRDITPEGSERRKGRDGSDNTTDLVVHVRDSDEHNLLAIEAKKRRKYNEKEFGEARERLQHLIENEERGFRLGLLLTYFTGEDFGISSEVVAPVVVAQPG